MTLEVIVFITAILFGILIYWRESNGNGLYRFFNKLMNSKELQMKPNDKKGFVFRQSFLLRLVFIAFLFIIAIVITRFLIPIDLATISIFASMIVGTVLGTYLAQFIFKSSEVIEDNSDSLQDVLKDTIEKGKDFIDEIKSPEKDVTEESHQENPTKIEEEVEKKSARERLKDKGLL